MSEVGSTIGLDISGLLSLLIFKLSSQSVSIFICSFIFILFYFFLFCFMLYFFYCELFAVSIFICFSFDSASGSRKCRTMLSVVQNESLFEQE